MKDLLAGLIGGGGIATPPALIDSGDVQDDSLRSRDVKDGTLHSKG